MLEKNILSKPGGRRSSNFPKRCWAQPF